MYTLLIISLASFFGMFFILANQKNVLLHIKEHNVSSERLAEVNKSLIRNFLVIVAKFILLAISTALSFAVTSLTRAQRVTETKLRETARRISHMGHNYRVKNPDGSSSSFLKDLARHKKLVAKRDK